MGTYALKKLARQEKRTAGQVWDEKYVGERLGTIDPEAFARQRFWPVLKAQFKKEGKYLDVGCGTGGWVLFLRQQGYDVVGIEIAAQTVARVKAATNIPISVGSITAIPYPNESFDGILALGVLEYAEGEVAQALQEVWRVLKPGGWVLLEVPIVNGLRKLLYIPLKRLEESMRRRQKQPMAFSNYLFDRRDLKRRLTGQGFRIVAEQPHELPEAGRHYGLWIDWKILRGGDQYRLNWLGKGVQWIAETISLWLASTGVVIVAHKRNEKLEIITAAAVSRQGGGN